MAIRSALIGIGNVGKALYTCLESVCGFSAPSLVMNSHSVYDGNFTRLDCAEQFMDHTGGLDIAFLAIPTDSQGDRELGYIRHFVGKRCPVVTCAKAAAAFHYLDIARFEKLLGLNAAVGGNTGMISFIRNKRTMHSYRPLESLEGVVNGSLNYLWDAMSRDVPRNKALFSALERGFTESPDFDFTAAVIGEINDARLKATILANESFFPEVVFHPSDIAVSNSLSEIVADAAERSKEYRFIVRIGREPLQPVEKVAFFSKKQQYMLYGGFEHWEALSQSLQLQGEHNSLIVRDCTGTGYASAPGAGTGPRYVAGMMLCDARTLLGI